MHDEGSLQPVQRQQVDTTSKGQNPKICADTIDIHFAVILLSCYFQRSCYSGNAQQQQ